MSLTSIVLLENTANAVSTIGEPLRTDDGYGNIGHRFTVSIHTSNLQGTVHIEGALTNAPEANDWFQATAPISFPREGSVLTTPGETASVGLSFTGNYAWIRARLDRDSLGNISPADIGPFGFVDRILLNR
ncbi:MAG: hypothetical protein EOP83_23720 [Verrucomicrobiaceae bacterium]|nr:MAG: hypothetical protein EOP83_23720 [Verrucomicrobiaceae bacterium]